MGERVAKNPIELPNGVNVTISKTGIDVKGPKGNLSFTIPDNISIAQNDNIINVTLLNEEQHTQELGGTTRAIVNNMVVGVSEGFEKKLVLVGVGYRAQIKGNVLDLTLGFSHPVTYAIPEGISIEIPIPTEIIIKGIDKQKVGQVAAEVRAFRPPEPYKGKGVRYADERISLKETKKK